MSTISINIIDGERGTLTRKGWETRERIAIVKRVGGTGHAKLDAAIIALRADSANRALFGDEHPTSAGCFLEELSPEATTSDDVRVRMVYKYPDFPDGGGETSSAVIEVGASLIQETVNTDVDGDLMTVTYGTKKQAGSISIPVPQVTARYQIRLAFSPGALAREFVGKISEGGWFIDPGADEKQWLCTGINGTSDDGGSTYLTTFEFAFLEENYDQTVVYIDPETGRMPDDIVDGTGIKVFQVLDTANFNDLPH